MSSPADNLRRVRLTVQYDGAAFRGWQRQANAPSVQATLEDALEQLLGERVRLHAAGRTDAGVHALALPVHFDTGNRIPTPKIAIAAAKFLPATVSILDARDAPDGFDARRSAILRWYRYQIRLGPVRQPLAGRAWLAYRPLDFGAMQAGLALLAGRHDFRGFRSAECRAKRTVLDLQQASCRREGDLLAFDFKCRSFLHHMVRFMTGSVVSMGLGSIDAARLTRIRDEGARPEIACCAPAEGLCLMGVAYDEAEARALLDADPPLPSF